MRMLIIGSRSRSIYGTCEERGELKVNTKADMLLPLYFRPHSISNDSILYDDVLLCVLGDREKLLRFS